MIRIEKKWEEVLLSKPETGMGYQIVEYKIGRIKQKGIVLNAEILINENEVESLKQFSLGLKETKFLETAESSRNIEEIEVLSRKEIISIDEIFLGFMKGMNIPAKDAKVSYTTKNEVFKRFSAFKNDKRITPEGGLLPGTYTTTEEDAKNVKTGKEAVDRYALPNDDPAIYVFTVKPPEDTEVKRGVVQPLDDKKGGGVEVLFINGSPSNTVEGPVEIPAE